MPFTTHSAETFGDIFICQFPFTSGAASKVRPALVLFDLEQDAIICRVTSVVRIGALNVTLKDWQTAGLVKPSIARLDRVVTAEKFIFVRRLGALSAEDQKAIRDRWIYQFKPRNSARPEAADDVVAKPSAEYLEDSLGTGGKNRLRKILTAGAGI